MIARLLQEGKRRGELRSDSDAGVVAEMIFAGMMGASVMYNVDKSGVNLDRTVNSLIDYLDQLGNIEENRRPRQGPAANHNQGGM